MNSVYVSEGINPFIDSPKDHGQRFTLGLNVHKCPSYNDVGIKLYQGVDTLQD